MDFNMEWNIICRVCLQEGEMCSIFDEDESGILICDKIMKCSDIQIERGVNLPENVCLKCLQDLKTAYEFRNNCESSNAVLQSFIKGNIVKDLVISSNGSNFKYKPPEGLNIRRLKKTNADQKIEYEDPDGPDDNVIKTEYSDYEDCQVILEMPEEIPLSQNESSDEEKVYHNSTEIERQEPTEEVVEIDGSYYTLKVSEAEHSDEILSDLPKRRAEKLPRTKEPQKKREPRMSKSKEEKPMHICEICGNCYKQKHSLEAHMRRHRNEKPFGCEICGRAFVLNVELKCHMRTHTGQKPYPCRYCGRRFSDFGSRIKHERVHTGERPYACETCGKAFAYSYGLSGHMLTHTGEKPFKCEKCDKRFSKKHHLKNHLNTHVRQEQRLLMKTGLPMLVNRQKKEEPESIDYTTSSVLTLITNDQAIEQYVEEVNMEEIKEEGENIIMELL